MRKQLTMLGVTAIATVAVAGCGSSSHHSTTRKPAPTSASTTAATGGTTSGTSTSATASSRMVLPVQAFRVNHQAFAFVKLTIKGRPYFFLVDTGASKSLVYPIVVKTLGLPDSGPATSAASLCTLSLQPVTISDWKLGNTALPTTVISTKSTFSGVKIKGIPIAGSLGADVLSRFGTVTIDLAGKRLILGGKPPTGGKTLPVKVGHAPDGEVALVLRATIGGKPVGYQIDTGAGRTTIDTGAAKRLGLPVAGKSVKSHTSICSAVTFTPVRLDSWTAGGVKLPKTVVVSSHSSITAKSKGKVVGLLALDILSTFGDVTFDFTGQRMVLGGTVG